MNKRLRQAGGSSRARKGTVLICVLACLLVATALITTAIKGSLRYRREAKAHHRALQANLMLDAGVRVARSEADVSNDNPLTLDLVDANQVGLGKVTITTRSSVEQAARYQVEIVARTENTSAQAAESELDLEPLRIQRSFEFINDPSSNPPGENP